MAGTAVTLCVLTRNVRKNRLKDSVPPMSPATCSLVLTGIVTSNLGKADVVIVKQLGSPEAPDMLIWPEKATLEDNSFFAQDSVF